MDNREQVELALKLQEAQLDDQVKMLNLMIEGLDPIADAKIIAAGLSLKRSIADYKYVMKNYCESVILFSELAYSKGLYT